MNLHQLQIFQTVAKLGSFSRAAEELHISQPSVSIQVADLERELGIELFEQLGRRIYLTEAGRLLEEYSRRILGMAEEAHTALQEIKGLRRGRLAVGASTTPGTYVLPRVIGQFQERYPQVTVTLEIANTRRIQERLLRAELDLGVVGWEATSRDLQADPFLDDELVLVVPPAHPLATAGVASAKELREHRLILREHGSGTRQALEAAAHAKSLALTPTMELGSSEAIKEAVAAGLGIAILSHLAVEREAAAGRLVIVPMSDLAVHRQFYVVHHRDKQLSGILKAFLEVLQGFVKTGAR